MIRAADTFTLAPGVAAAGDALRDEARGLRIPLNAAAVAVVAAAGGTVGTAAARLAARFALPHERALDDVAEFLRDASRHALVEVRPRRRTRARDALHGLLHGRLPAVAPRRRVVATSTAGAAASSVARALAGHAARVGGVAAAVVAPADAAAAPAVGVGVATGLLLHELGHVLALRGLPAAVVRRTVAVLVLHPPLPRGRRAFVAAAGPLLAVAVGVAVSVGGAEAVAVPLLAHASALTIAAPDGRAACAC